MLGRRVSRLVAALAAGATITTGCAAASTTARPAPFPGRAPIYRAPAPDAALADAIVMHAVALRGIRYRLGGDRPESGLDCSGLVRHVFMQANIPLPRTVAEQFVVGQRIDEANLHAGDLVFFETTHRGPSHVGIVVERGTFIHAPGDGRVVRVDRLDLPYWRDRWLGAKRVLAVPTAPVPAPAAP